MQHTDFSKLSPGSLLPTVRGAVAFAPDQAPRRLDLEPTSIRLLARAEHRLGVLGGAAQRLVNPYLISAPLLRQEAILSSRIEGTISTPEQLVLVELGAEPRTPDVREVGNFVAATRHALDALKKGDPITSRLLLATHRKLMSGVRGENQRPGEYRDTQNFIGATTDILQARYVPPPHTEVARLLSDLETFINTDTPDLPHLVRIAIAHYQFEAIHPFRDGNGRIGRLLITLMLVRDGLLPGPLLPISLYFEQHRDAYADHLFRVSTQGAWLPWVRFFLEAVLYGAELAVAQVEGLIALRQEWHARFQSARSSALLLKLIDALFRTPGITVGDAAKLLGVTQASASGNVTKLVEAGILREVTGRKRDRIFLAPQILDFIGGMRPPPTAGTGATASPPPNNQAADA